MSTATPFRYRQPFPFCVTDISGTIGAAFDGIYGLGLAQVMEFYWNLETLTIQTTGSATGGGVTNCGSLLYINPVASSTPFDQGSTSGAWFGEVSSTSLASFPSFRQPRERVCYGSSLQELASIGMTYTGGPYLAAGAITFRVGVDPSDSTKFVLYYELLFEFENYLEESAYIAFANPNRNSGSVLTSGTFSIGSLTFDWVVSDYGTSVSQSGLGLSASSSFFTY